MKKSAGFSLMEVLVAMAISAILILIVGSLITMINRHFFQTKEKLLAEEMAARAESLLRAYLSQAIDIGATVDGTWVLTGGKAGQIQDNISFKQISDSAAWTLIAAFPREVNHAIDPEQHGSIQNVAIWYRRPEAATNKTGVIFINTSNNLTLKPDYNGDVIDRVSLLEITKNPHSVSDRTMSVDIHLQIRYHYLANGKTTWCPALDLKNGTAGCDNTAPWMDIDRQFTVLLRNNLMKAAGSIGASSVASEERVLGNLYFFQPLMPMR